MSRVSYIDDNALMAEAFLKRDYSAVSDFILQHAGRYSFSLNHDGNIYAYNIQKNEPLSKIYSFDCYVVKFVFNSVETLHTPEQKAIMEELCNSLKHELVNINGYINVRLPSHIIDLIKVFNEVFVSEELYFCGGTVEEVQVGEPVREYLNHPEVKLFFADKEYIDSNIDRIIEIVNEGFKQYQGQYHISPITAELAPQIYTNWIRESVSSSTGDMILIAEIDDSIVGYCTIRKKNSIYEGLLSSVDPAYRRSSVYKSMISFLSEYAGNNNGSFISSTQFDNYAVQGAWNSLGLRPFYSIYNFHINMTETL